MNSEQRELVKKLREIGIEKFGTLPATDDDENGFNLLRFLNAYGNDIEKVIPRLEETLEFRKSFKFDELGEKIDSCEFRNDFHPVLLSHFPGGKESTVSEF